MDAQASDERPIVAGWLPAAGPDGRPDPAFSYLFSEEVTEQNFPWVFRKDGKAASVIATLGNATFGSYLLPRRPGEQEDRAHGGPLLHG